MYWNVVNSDVPSFPSMTFEVNRLQHDPPLSGATGTWCPLKDWMYNIIMIVKNEAMKVSFF